MTTSANYLPTKKHLIIWLSFLGITLASFLFQLPSSANINILFGDIGAALRVDSLLAQGYAPTVDFTYLYGFLPLVIGRVWFAIFGRTPQAYIEAMLVFNLLMASLLARIAILAKLRNLGIIFLAVSIPFAIRTLNPNFTHAIESILISLAILEHLSKRRGNALLILVFGYFTKPSMSLIYAFCLIILYFIDLLKNNIRVEKVYKELLPSLLAACSLGIAFTIIFGFIPTINSILLPITGSAHYKAMNYGFFGIGRDFWNPSGGNFNYYLGTPAGFWIVATLTLFLIALFHLTQNFRNLSSIQEVQICLALLHLFFILRLWGSAWSWSYYAYCLIIGVSLIATHEYDNRSRKKLINILMICLILFTLLSNYASFSVLNRDWKSLSLQPSGLFGTSEMTTELNQVLSYCQNFKSIVLGLGGSGGLNAVFPQCQGLDTWFLLPGVFNQSEFKRIKSQVSNTEIIIRTNILTQYNISDMLNQTYQDYFNTDLNKEFKLFRETKYFQYYQRIKN